MTQNKRPEGNATLPMAERSLSERGWDSQVNRLRGTASNINATQSIQFR